MVRLAALAALFALAACSPTVTARKSSSSGSGSGSSGAHIGSTSSSRFTAASSSGTSSTSTSGTTTSTTTSSSTTSSSTTSGATTTTSGTGTSTTSSSTTTTGTSGTLAICADCTASSQCASSFCDIYDTAGDGFCDSTNPCTGNADCQGQAQCDTSLGDCACPQVGGTSSSGSTGGSTGGTGTSSCTSCTASSQCSGGHCLKESGGTNYYCGADCSSDPSVCPSGWTCSLLSSGLSGCRAVSPTCP